MMRVMDGLMAIPSILLAIAVVSLSGASLMTVLVAITIPEIPRVARLVRSVVLSAREEPYVEAAISVGSSLPKIMWRHLMPNTVAPLIVQGTYVAASAILTEAILSFLGAGISPETPTWGNIMAEGRAYFQIKPSLIFWPGLMLSVAILSVNLIGDAARDALDPRMKRAGGRQVNKAPNTNAVVLDIDNLVVGLGKNPANQRVIDGVSLQVREGETLCLVGESGSGKSVTSLTVMGLLQKGSLVPSGGTVKLVGEEILTASDRRLRQLRATTMAMIFQEPMTALNPVVPVGRQIDEVLRAHTDLDARARKKRILDMMEQVRLPEVARIFASYPHRLSGGQRQRIMIAMALVLEPKLLIADEPTTALDVTTQKQILTLIRDLQRDHGTAVLFITHDMGVVAEIADRVAVMRYGKLVETGSLQSILRTPTMEYTRNLLSSVPSLIPRAPRAESTEPVVLEANELGKVYRERSFFGSRARSRRRARTSPSRCARAARSASSAKAAPANPPWRAASCG